MTFYRTTIQPAGVLLCGLVLAIASGCATATRPAPQTAADLPSASPPAAAKSVTPTPKAPSPTQNTTPPAALIGASQNPPVAAAITAPPIVPIPAATIKGSEETSILLDNFTAFVASIDGKKNTVGRIGWDSPLTIEAGRHALEVEFNRGVFFARTTLEIEAKADAHYAVRFTTDAELFGHNTFCDFWIIDLTTGKAVTAVAKASVNKIASPSDR